MGIGSFEEEIARWGRFWIVDIEVRTHVGSSLEHPSQGIMLHDESSAGVDQDGIMFHAIKKIIADEAAVGSSAVDVDRQHVGFGEERFD